MTYPRGTLIRNATATRINHWMTAGCFVLLLLSGLSMFHPCCSGSPNCSAEASGRARFIPGSGSCCC